MSISYNIVLNNLNVQNEQRSKFYDGQKEELIIYCEKMFILFVKNYGGV